MDLFIWSLIPIPFTPNSLSLSSADEKLNLLILIILLKNIGRSVQKFETCFTDFEFTSDSGLHLLNMQISFLGILSIVNLLRSLDRNSSNLL